MGIYSYTGDGTDKRIINLNIPTNKKILFASIKCSSYVANNPNSSVATSVFIHNVDLIGYEISKQGGNHIAQFNQTNSLLVYNDSKASGTAVPRLNLDGIKYEIIVFFS